MLARLQAIGRGARGHAREPEVRKEQPVAARPLSAEDSVLLLIPTDGGMAFRLFAVESEDAAAAFVQEHYPQLAGKSFTFQPRPAHFAQIPGDNAEALVLVADNSRPGMVYVSSFEEMEAAQSFVRFEEENGLDINLVKTYWGVPQPVSAIARTAAAANAVAMPLTPAPSRVPRPVAPANGGTGRRAKPVARENEAVSGEKEGILDSIRDWPGWDTLRARITAVSLLNSDIYEAIRKDPIAFSQARTIVATAAAASGVGALWFGPLAVISFAVMGVVGWLAGAHLTHWVGTKLFTGRQSEESKIWLFKSLGFAQAPRLLVLLGLAMPGFGLLLALAAFVWVLVASIPAVEETLELDTQSALLSAMTGWLAMFALEQAAPLMLA